MKHSAYPRYKPSDIEWLGEVPEHWEAKRIKDIGRIRYGLGEPPEYADDGLPFIRATDISRGKIDLAVVKRVSPSDVPWSRRPLLVEDEILVVRSGAYTGDSAIVNEKIAGCVAGYDMVLTVTSARSSFVAWALLSKYLLESQIMLARLRAAQPHLNAEELGGFVFLAPSLREQQAIADFLDRETAKIDTLVGKKRTLIERLKEKRTALISRTVTRGLPPDAARAAGLDPHPKLKPSGIEWLGEVPDHWGVAQLRRFTRFITSGSRGWAEHYADDGAIFVRIGNLTRDSIRIDLSDVQHVDPPDGSEGERTRIALGDVLFSITAYLGSVGVADESVLGGYINQHIALVRLGADSLAPRFAAYAALGDASQAQLSGQGYGGTKIQLALDDVKSLWLPIPPPSEQQAIADFLDRETAKLDQMLAKIEVVIDRLQEHRSALITAAVTGKIDVRTLCGGSHYGNNTC